VRTTRGYHAAVIAEMPSLSMIDVCKSEGRRNRRVQILRDVSLSVVAGEIVGIIEQQPSAGATLLQMAAGWLRPDAGQICLGPVNLTRLSARKRDALCCRNVLWVDHLLPPADMKMTVHGHLFWSVLASSSYRRGNRRQEADRMVLHGLECLGASELAPIPLQKLSFWERILAELARIIATRRQFVVVDGLFDGLSTAQAQRARRLLRMSVDEAGCAVLLTVSDLMSAWVADYVWRLDKGELTLVYGLPQDGRKVVALETSGEGSISGTGFETPSRDLRTNLTVHERRSARESEGVPGVGHAGGVADAVSELLATEAALDKLGARGISLLETEQTIWNRHVIVKNRRGAPQRRQPSARRLLIGRSDTGRVLTLVIEETVDSTTWLLVTGWDSTPAERNILERS
jgi:ABC-type branched-subunit amino acid transport system ATPase component